MFLHERFCNICEKTTAHVNGDCMSCRENIEKADFKNFMQERSNSTIEERLEFIETWIYENQHKLNAGASQASLHTKLG